MHEALKIIKANENGQFICNIGELNLYKANDINSISYDSKFTGEASNELSDDDDQIIIQKGLDWTPYLTNGVFKDHHPVLHPETKQLIYVPKTVAEPIGKKAWYEKSNNRWMVEGRFLPRVKQANELVDLAKSYILNESPRKLKFSIEGQMDELSDDKKIVWKARVFNVIITEDPKNDGTELNFLAKSLSILQKGVTSSSMTNFKKEDLEGSASLQIPPGLIQDLTKYKGKLVNILLKEFKGKMSRPQANKYVDSFLNKKTIKLVGGKNV